MIRHLAFLSLALSVCVLAQPAAPAPGSIEISFETQPYKGKYSPRHVLAAWVVDAQGQHVRTLAVYANKQMRRLAAWRKVIGNSRPDAVTGATRKKHEPLTLLWDGTDQAGNPVPDGKYQIVVEYTEINGAGPVLEIQIEKGRPEGTRIPKANKHFRNISVRTIGVESKVKKAR